MFALAKRRAHRIIRFVKEQTGFELDCFLFSVEGRIRSSLSTRRVTKQGAPLRVLAHVNKATTHSRGGAEKSLFSLLRYLHDHGCEVRVLAGKKSTVGVHLGINVEFYEKPQRRRELYEWSDIILTQLGWAKDAAKFAMRYGRPWVHFIRDAREAPQRGSPDLVVFNSRSGWSRSKWRGQSMVLYPPISRGDYKTEKGDAVLLVNLSDFKGGHVFYELADALPTHKFVGCIGGWGEQIVPKVLPPNVSLVQPCDDMRQVYSRARIVIMPSVNESFGRVAVEAGCSGIPVIGSPVDGLKEVLGADGLFADRSDLKQWIDHILELDDPQRYQEASQYALERAECFTGGSSMAEFLKRIQHIVLERK